MTHLRVATYNTWNCQGDLDRRLALMSSGLQAVNADVVLLQEVFAEVPSGHDVARQLARDLNMNVAYAPTRKKLRPLNGAPVLGCSGLAVLTRGEIHTHQIVRLPEDTRDGERLAQVVSTDIGGTTVLLANVHLSHLTDADGLRQNQIEVLMDHLANARACDVTILGGDMNMTQGHSTLMELQTNRGFQLALCKIPPTTTLNPVEAGAPSMGVIDHILVKAPKDCRIEAQTALNAPDSASGFYPSDHMAVIADIDCR
ncbi:endonuclease/exonuclease/phosphatase family protein [Magnetovibrio sp.]|uniref:endonuclease/exonuclease/phosphatase family protein n=1 Tax=Magnetovibrio sp. TaxID=2024836 RepID=UPI002F92C834